MRAVQRRRPWVLWDGDCGVCAWSAWWIRRLDPEGTLRLVAYQDASDPPVGTALRRECERAVHLLLPDGELLRAGGACLEILDRLGHHRMARFLRLPPMLWLVEGGYWLVARSRSVIGRFLPAPPDMRRRE